MEGPPIHLVAEELQPFINEKIKECYGNAKFDKDHIIKQKITSIYACGKRLVIRLTDYVIVTHFLMWGSYRINEQREGKAPRLALITSKNSLFIYSCSVKCLKISNFASELDFEIDILSDTWNPKKIIKLIKSNPKSSIDDVLLDQSIFAGVGNIIKNEVLFLSKISPYSKIKDLKLNQLKNIALNAREFSENFLKWRRVHQLKKHLLIYHKKECPNCGSKVARAKTGKRNRWSFFCPKCQK